MDLSIIVVNWNTIELLKNCIQSIYTYPPCYDYELIVVDNASSDGSPEMVRGEFPRVRLIQNSRNAGFATANNQGIAQSTGKLVLLLNSDTVVRANALDRLVEFMKAHPQAGGAGSLLLNANGSMQNSCYPFPTVAREIWRLFHMDILHPYGVYRMAKWDRQAPREVDHIQGASLILRRETLDQVGLLDEDFFMYSEEQDLCFRIKKSGWKLFWVPQSEVVHFGGQSTRQVAEKMFLELYRSKVLFFRKNHPRLAGLYKLALLAASLFRLSLTPLLLIERGELRAWHKIRIKLHLRLIEKLPGM